jgi:hypothetical protein
MHAPNVTVDQYLALSPAYQRWCSNVSPEACNIASYTTYLRGSTTCFVISRFYSQHLSYAMRWSCMLTKSQTIGKPLYSKLRKRDGLPVILNMS